MKKQKPSCPRGQGRLSRCKTYCFFSVESALLPEPLAGGVLEPLAAPLDGAEEVLGEVLAEPLALDEPPEAESFFGASAEEEEELEDDGGVLGVAPAELEDEEGGVLGFTVTEPDAEDEPDGAVADPDGVVVEPLDEEEDAPG